MWKLEKKSNCWFDSAFPIDTSSEETNDAQVCSNITPCGDVETKQSLADKPPVTKSINITPKPHVAAESVKNTAITLTPKQDLVGLSAAIARRIQAMDNATKSNLNTPRSKQQNNFDTVTNKRANATDITPIQDPVLRRLQSDLNSPSAAAYLRAKRALQTPNNNAYCVFDVPHDEQSIITAEERNPLPQLTLQEILKDIIVYVEVRTDQDNRSSGVKSVIAQMGAQVNDNLLRNTTHVVFKDGRLSTYKKAIKWNIPVVSILWIEACKVQRKICDPKIFPISNIKYYEFPELYPKLPRVRCMQPDADLDRRPRKRAVTPKSTSEPVPAKGTNKKIISTTSTENITPTSNQKTTITNFFTPVSLQKPSASIHNEMATESPATLLLNRISSGCFTPVPSSLARVTAKEFTQKNTGDGPSQPIAKKIMAQKSLSFNEMPCEGVSTPKTRGRRSSVEPVALASAPMTRRRSSLHVITSQAVNTDSQITPEPKMTRRRSALHVSCSQSEKPLHTSTTEPRMTRRRSSLQLCTQDEQTTSQLIKTQTFQSITEEAEIIEIKNDNGGLSNSDMILSDVSEHEKTKCLAESMDISSSQLDFSNKKNPRRTLYATECMEIDGNTNSSSGDFLKKSNRSLSELYSRHDASTRSSKSTSDNELTPVPLFSSTRMPGSINNTSNRRRSLYNVGMDVINERINSINTTATRLLKVQQNGETNIKERSSSNENQTSQAVESAASESSENLNATPVQPKMRKLFIPNEEILFSPPKSTKKSRLSMCAASSNSSVRKRRRTLAAPSTSSTSASSLDANEFFSAHDANTVDEDMGKTLRQKALARRSTLDFEPKPPQKVNTENIQVGQIDSATENVTSPAETSSSTNSKKDNTGSPSKKRARTIHTLVHTNMHNTQIQVIQQAVKKLPGMRLDPTVTNRTTHLVSLEPRRTLNLIRGLMRGVWIVSYKWVLDSLREGKWVNEERYEMKSFSRAVEICRAERQAFGIHYNCELFRFMEPFFVSSTCRPIQFNNIKELLLLGGAKLTENRFKAQYIIGDKRRTVDDRVYLSPYWVLDSVTAMQIQKFGKYIMKSAIVTPVGIRYENPTHGLCRTYKDPELVIDK